MAALGRIGMVAGLHVAALYLIAAGLGVVPGILPKAMVGTIIPQQTVPDDPPPPMPDYVPTEPRIIIPAPDFPVPDTAPSPDQISATVSDEISVLPEVIPAPEVKLVGVRPDSRFPLTQPPYPVSEVRAGNEGTAEIEVYVMPNGRVGDARIVKSTGFPALDQSALDEARRRWRLMPATRDGEPYAQWHRLRVVFKLQNR